MMQHRRTLASVKTMAPSLLVVDDGTASTMAASSGNALGEKPSPADAAAGSPKRPAKTTNDDPSSQPLPQQMVTLHTQIQTLLQSAESNLVEAQHLKSRAGEAAVQAKMHGAWPIENVAARRGVALSSIKGLLSDSSTANVQSTTAPSGGNTPSAGSCRQHGRRPCLIFEPVRYDEHRRRRPPANHGHSCLARRSDRIHAQSVLLGGVARFRTTRFSCPA